MTDALLDAVRVYASPREKERLGREHDGGYILCALDGYDGFLSGGIADDVSFEVDVLRLHPTLVCHAFDGTIAQPPATPSRLVFEPRNIGAVESPTETNLHSFLDDHDNVLVKMDIEGAEYAWLESLSTEQLAAIRQLVIEFHPPLSDRRTAVLSRLTHTHRLVHFHPNNESGTRDFNGVAVPLLFEATYIRRSEFTVAPPLSHDPIPGPLDRPNLPERPEIHLSGYPYNDD